MISKRMIMILIFLVFICLDSDAIGRGGGSKSRIGSHSYSADNLSHGPFQDPGRAILAIIFMILSCGGGIGWRIYRCCRNTQRSKCVQPQIPYPNNTSTYLILKPTVNRLNQRDLSPTRYPVTSSSIESFDHISEKMFHKKRLEEIQAQQIRSKKEKYSIIIPRKDTNTSSHVNWTSTLL